MIRLFANANYDFIKWRRWAYMLTALMILPGLVVLAGRGINYSIEFTGGTQRQVRTHKVVDIGVLRPALDRAGIKGAEIAPFGSDSEFLIRARLGAHATGPGGGTEATAAAVDRALAARLGAGTYTVVPHEAVEPKVGPELQGKAFPPIAFSFAFTLAYPPCLLPRR